MNKRYYLLKIQLLDIEPEIWRRLIVPADITLDRLHDMIQIAMGWEDCHLHEFIIKKQRYTDSPEEDFMFDEFDQNIKEEGVYRLSDLVKRKGQKFYYTYDFGDDWNHLITLENSRVPFNDPEIPVLAGENACPPEDIGGPYGYLHFCEIISNPNHDMYEEYREWAGENFEPSEFNASKTYLELMKYIRWSRDRMLPWDDELIDD